MPDRTENRTIMCFCRHSDVIDQETADGVLAGLIGMNRPFTAVPDLCGLAAAKSPFVLGDVPAGSTVIACFARAVRNLPGLDLGECNVLNMREMCHCGITGALAEQDASTAPVSPAGPEAVEVLLGESSPEMFHIAKALLEAGVAVTAFGEGNDDYQPTGRAVVRIDCPQIGCGDKAVLDINSAAIEPEQVAGRVLQFAAEHQAKADSEWIPWFPVLDRSRCIDCKKCMSFCLFGVYSLVDGKVTVTSPDKCKTNCPACARMCPTAAIVFPKYDKAPINGSDEQAGEAVKVDDEEIASGDIYARLRNRSDGARRRFAPAEDLASGCGCSTADSLQETLDIPDEVLRTVSAEQLQARAKSVAAPPPRAADCGCSNSASEDSVSTDCGSDCACHSDETAGDCGPDCACHDEPAEPSTGGRCACDGKGCS
ncbi:MAG: hypothetical protein ACLFVU_00545 [Phycisphaerae bacterium]